MHPASFPFSGTGRKYRMVTAGKLRYASGPMKVTRAALLGVALAIFASALWLHWPSVNGGFLTRMDDDEYLRQSVRWQGLSWGAVRWAFTSTEPYYQPLPRLSHVLDYQLWGTNAQGHHATSVVNHALNAAIVFGFLRTILGVVAGSLTMRERLALAIGVAVVFAIHPLQVESVAWMSGRTQLLCTTFGIGSLWAYVAGTRRWLVWAMFIAALLCKPLAVSLPFAMLALDYLLARRDGEPKWGRLLRRNAGLIAVGVAAAVTTIITESRTGGLLVPLETIRPSQRMLLMAQSLVFYPCKLAWPTQLSPYYPRPVNISMFQPFAFASVLGVTVITALCIWRGRRAPALMAGWGTYVLFVLPVSGLTPTGGQAVADRYAYLAMLPLLVLAGGAVVWLWRRSPMIGRCGLVCLLVGELFFFGMRTRAQTLVWRNDETLWRGVLAQFPNSDLANEMLAQALLNENRIPEALVHAQHAVEVAPSAETHRNLGIALTQAGEIQEATDEFNLALQLKPDMADAHCRLGVFLQREGKYEEAIRHYEQALQTDPDYADAHYNLGTALVRLDRMTEAMEQWEEALRIDPDYAEAHANLGVALEQAGKLEDAVAHYEQALRVRPDLAAVHYDLGNVLARLGRMPAAIQQYGEALRLNPDYTEARNALVRLHTVQ
ncbi:MAG TPA: tetratricopeptide repeat protein [Verrucomicrobiae bacterium]|nr:tetratricopeptide repeat protein [Verrucomicrobiae bacterium]